MKQVIGKTHFPTLPIPDRIPASLLPKRLPEVVAALLAH
jgi:hypothetical protein